MSRGLSDTAKKHSQILSYCYTQKSFPGFQIGATRAPTDEETCHDWTATAKRKKKKKIRSLQKSMLQIRVEEQRQNLRHDHPSCYRCVATGRPPRPQPLSGQRTAAALDMFTTPSAARRAARPASGELTPPDRHLVTPVPHSEPYKWGYADF